MLFASLAVSIVSSKIEETQADKVLDHSPSGPKTWIVYWKRKESREICSLMVQAC